MPHSGKRVREFWKLSYFNIGDNTKVWPCNDPYFLKKNNQTQMW